jgi:hypothetical protein
MTETELSTMEAMEGHGGICLEGLDAAGGGSREGRVPTDEHSSYVEQECSSVGTLPSRRPAEPGVQPRCLTYAPWPSMNSMVKGF